jgi:HSP20 family protein
MAEKMKSSNDTGKTAKESTFVERTSHMRTYAPAVDITEDKNNLYIHADMPGADEKSVNITLENNILTIEAHVDDVDVQDREIVGAEYASGDYYRVFTVSEAIDRNKIEAKMKHGMLNIILPKAEVAKVKSIPIKEA